jgi:hypothetical protein
MRTKAFLFTAALTLAGSLSMGQVSAQDYDDNYGGNSDDNYQYYDEGYQNDDDAEVYYENYYGANNAYDLYFHSALGSYGEWVLAPGLGWVWRPYTVSTWSPYTLGYWGWNSNDWNWVSYEPYGHITYHYGNWGYLNSYGWCWFPGYRWAPNTVTWSSYDGYVGWAPAPPHIYGAYGSHYYQNDRHYVWCANNNFLSRDIHQHTYRSSDLWRGRAVPRNIPVLSSPSRGFAERWAGHAAERIELQTASRRTRRGTVQVYLPDQRTREEVRREGRTQVRPWLDTTRVNAARRVRPWDRDGTDSQRQPRPERGVDVRSENQGRTRPWQRDPRDTEVRTENPRRSTPTDHRKDVRVGTDTNQDDNHRSTPWRRYRKSDDSNRASHDSSGRATEERRRQPREEPKHESRKSEERKSEERKSEDGKSDDSGREDKGSRKSKDDGDQNKVEARPHRGHKP